MSEVRDLRRQTKKALEEERRRGEQQIARLREENRKEIQRLETEQEEQLASYRQQLRELEKRQAEAVRLADRGTRVICVALYTPAVLENAPENAWHILAWQYQQIALDAVRDLLDS